MTNGDPAPRKSSGLLWRIWIVVLVAAGVGAIILQGYQEFGRLKPVSDGALAPDFQVEKYGGGEIRLSDLKGKIVLIDFWATWCPPCVDEMPYLMRITGEFAERGVVLLAADQIQADSKAAVGVFLTRRGIVPPPNAHVVFAPDAVLNRYQIRALPTLYFIDREGKIVDVVQGQISERSLRSRLEELVEASPPT